MKILLGTLGKHMSTNYLVISAAVASALMMSGFHGQTSAPASAFMKALKHLVEIVVRGKLTVQTLMPTAHRIRIDQLRST